MDGSRFEFEGGPGAPDAPARPWQDPAPANEMSAAPADGKEDERRGEEETDEPGYGHGV